MNKKDGLSRYRLERPMRALCVDPTATQAAVFLGLSRTSVSRDLGLFRAAIALHQRARQARVIGTVEVDESYFGRSRRRDVTGRLKPGRGTLKQPVFGIFERGERVFTEIAPDTNKVAHRRRVRDRIAHEAVIVSDGWRACAMNASTRRSSTALLMPGERWPSGATITTLSGRIPRWTTRPPQKRAERSSKLIASRPARLPHPKPTTIKPKDSRYDRGTTGGQVNPPRLTAWIHDVNPSRSKLCNNADCKLSLFMHNQYRPKPRMPLG